MQAKSIILNQLKLITQLKNFISKVTLDKTFENALNKEFAHFLQKIQPKTYGKDLIRYFESTTAIPKTLDKQTDQETSPSSIYLPKVFSGLTFGIGMKVEKKEVIPKWKMGKPTVSKESITCRTSQILSSVMVAETVKSRHSRIEDLIHHLKQYPEAKHNAVKVSFLLI